MLDTSELKFGYICLNRHLTAKHSVQFAQFWRQETVALKTQLEEPGAPVLRSKHRSFVSKVVPNHGK